MTRQQISTNIYFNGYCPESALRGRKVRMRLNQDDFWESEETGLLITTFPPYAAILQWRGEGKFKQHEEYATAYHKHLLLCRPSVEKGQEIFPDAKEILDNSFDLQAYIESIYANYGAYLQGQIDLQTPVFRQQKAYLEIIATEEWENLLGLYREVQREGLTGEEFQQFHQMLYQLKVIFNFAWKRWGQGRKALKEDTVEYKGLTLLQISMYLTIIFREDRFSDCALTHYFKSGIMTKLFDQLEEIT